MRTKGQSLAVAYRPKTFEEVCGQNITVKILQKTLETGNLRNCYLFAGDSGCGKTTCARIFANLINGGIGEPIEIDAASNNGVDNVRALIDSANQRALVGEYKIFIIDECHAITTQGWQAFLKGIEEPPAYTIFMFCTTEPNKLPVAILNRVQRYNITKINTVDMKARLEYICKEEGYTNYEALCDLLSKTTHGCMRDAIMKLEQCADFSTDLSLNNSLQVLGALSYEAMFKLTWALQDKNSGEILAILDKLANNSVDLKQFMEVYLEFCLDLQKFALFNNIDITSIPAYFASTECPMVQQTITISEFISWCMRLVDTLLEIKLETRYDTFYKSTIEAFLLRFIIKD
jgi:DNA polymerase-3 subunit gamma/tau